MRQRGFTLIELMIVLTIGGILIAIIAPALFGFWGKSDSTISYGINGMTEVRCIDGYKFVIGDRGQARQIIDEFGKGARCETASVPNGIR